LALRSRLFRASKQLQACLLYDYAHVTPGSRGDHVYRIQTALTWLDYDIDPKELKGSVYGPSTADAVLDYKTQRSIINRSYQTQADNIVGKMTIAAMDQELYDLDRAATRVAAKADCEFCKNLEETDEASPGGTQSA
jgi:peptidoglycan hydrolase-like protein with peptidoglycan-binding domain